MQQRPRQSHTLLHPMTQAFDVTVLHIRDAGQFHDVINPRRTTFGSHIKRSTEEVQILTNAHIVVGPELVRHVANKTLDLSRVAQAIHPGNRSFPRRRLDQTNEDLDRRRFSGPVRTNQPQDLTSIQSQRQIIQRCE